MVGQVVCVNYSTNNILLGMPYDFGQISVQYI